MSASPPFIPLSPRRSSGNQQRLSVQVVAQLDGTSPAQAHARRLGVPSPRRGNIFSSGTSGDGSSADSAQASDDPSALSQDKLAAGRAAADGMGMGPGAASPILGPLNHRPALIRFSSGARGSINGFGNKGSGSMNNSPAHSAGGSIELPSPMHGGGRQLSALTLPPTSTTPGSTGSTPSTGAAAAPAGSGVDSLTPLGGSGWEAGGSGGTPSLRGSGNFEITFRQMHAQNEALLQAKERKRQKVLRTSSQAALFASSTPPGTGDAEQALAGYSHLRRLRSANDIDSATEGENITISLTAPALSDKATATPAPLPTVAASSSTVTSAREHREKERSARAAQAARYREERERALQEEQEQESKLAAAPLSIAASPASAAPSSPTDSEASTAELEQPAMQRSHTEPHRSVSAVLTPAPSSPVSEGRRGLASEGCGVLPPSEAATVGKQAALEAEAAARQQHQVAMQQREALAMQAASGVDTTTSSAGNVATTAETVSASDSAFVGALSPPELLVQNSRSVQPDEQSTTAASVPASAVRESPRHSDSGVTVSIAPPVQPLSITSSPSSSPICTYTVPLKRETSDLLLTSASVPGLPLHSRTHSSDGMPPAGRRRRLSRDQGSNNLGAAALVPLPSTPLSNSSSGTPVRGESPVGLRPASNSAPDSRPFDSLRPGHRSQRSFSGSPVPGGVMGSGSPNYLDPTYGSKHYAAALANAVASGAATANSRSASRSPSPAAPQKERHVVFAEQLVQEESFYPRSRSVSPAPLHSRAGGGPGSATSAPTTPRRKKSALKMPSSQHSSANMRAVVSQMLSPTNSASSASGGSSSSSSCAAPVALFSSHAPFVSPLSLLRFQVALFHDAVNLLAYCTHLTRKGGILVKYNSAGKPMNRWFYVRETKDDVKLCWCAPKVSRTKPPSEINPNGLGVKAVEEEEATVAAQQAMAESAQAQAQATQAPPGGGGGGGGRKGTVGGAPVDALTTRPASGSVSGASSSSAAAAAAPASSSTTSSLLPSFSIGRWKFNVDRSRSLLEVSGVHYGPYYSANFCRFLDRAAEKAAAAKAHASASSASSSSSSASAAAAGAAHAPQMDLLKPWLCFSVQFRDRTIDLMGKDEHEVTAWFLGLQAQAPMTVYHMSRGMILWQRLIMKWNHYGTPQIRAACNRSAVARIPATTP